MVGVVYFYWSSLQTNGCCGCLSVHLCEHSICYLYIMSTARLPYMQLTNDHFNLSNNKKGKKDIFMVLKKKKLKKGNLRFFHWQSMTFLRLTHRTAPMHGNHWKNNSIIVRGTGPRGGSGHFARRGFNHITIKRFIFFPMLLVHFFFLRL